MTVCGFRSVCGWLLRYFSLVVIFMCVFETYYDTDKTFLLCFFAARASSSVRRTSCRWTTPRYNSSDYANSDKEAKSGFLSTTSVNTP